MNELKQSGLFITKHLKISDSKLFYSISKFGNSEESVIAFENISPDIVTHKQSNNILIYIALFIYGLSAILIIDMLSGGESESIFLAMYLTAATSLVVYYFITRKEYWKINLTNTGHFSVEKTSPSKEEVSTFLELLMKARKKHLIENYTAIDENIDYATQLDNLNWLKSMEVISKVEYEKLYLQLKTTVKPEKKRIGFGNN